MSMRRVVSITLLVIGVSLGFACSDNNTTPDTGPQDRGVDKAPAPDLPPPDADITKKPKIIKILPGDGFSNGSSTGKGTPVLLSGENFEQGATVFIDGKPQALTVAVISSVSMQFLMPPNPYDITRTAIVSVSVLVKGMMSNSVNFQFTVTKAMDTTFKGSITTKTQDAFSEFWTPDITGQVYVKGLTDTTTTEQKQKLAAFIGFGNSLTDPSKQTGWQWFPATFSKADSTTGYHIYTGKFKPPLDKTYAMAYRFSYDSQGLQQFGHFVYGDTDETVLAYETTKEATVKSTPAKIGYCQDNNDCVTKSMSAWTHTCLLSKVSWKLHKCVDCLADADCKRNKTSLGPWCDTAKYYCTCKATTDCTNNPNGFLCQTSTRGKICSCKADKDCPTGKTCDKGLCI